MKIGEYITKFMVLAVCCAMIFPSAALAQPNQAAVLKARFQTEAQKYSASMQQCAGIYSRIKDKTALTDADIAELDKWANTHYESLQYARSKALTAAMNVTEFEQGVKEAARGKDPNQFIQELDADPSRILRIRGASAADKAFREATKGAEVLRQISDKLKAVGRTSSLLTPQEGYRLPAGMVRVSFSPNSSPYSLSPVHMRRDAAEVEPPMMQALEAVLISLAAAYLGVQITRLTTGAIKACVDRAYSKYTSCFRRASNSTGRLACQISWFADVYICVIFPI